MTTLTAVRAATPDRPGRRPSRLLTCDLLAGPLFILMFLLERALRAEYEPLRHPVSSLALGPWGFLQVLNFLVAGLLTLAYAVGLRRRLRPGPGELWAPLFVGTWALGLFGAGVFATDPVSGYPPGTPVQPVSATWHGLAHDLFSLVGFFGLAAAMFVMAFAFAMRHAPGWSVYSGLSGVAFLALFILASAGFSQTAALVATAGLWQRLAVGLGWLWLAALAARQRRRDCRSLVAPDRQ